LGYGRRENGVTPSQELLAGDRYGLVECPATYGFGILENPLAAFCFCRSGSRPRG
jgi:hypothetical protein